MWAGKELAARLPNPWPKRHPPDLCLSIEAGRRAEPKRRLRCSGRLAQAEPNGGRQHQAALRDQFRPQPPGQGRRGKDRGEIRSGGYNRTPQTSVDEQTACQMGAQTLSLLQAVKRRAQGRCTIR